MMQRYKQPHFDVHPDGEWIRYEDHVEAMKRIAGDSAQQAEREKMDRLFKRLPDETIEDHLDRFSAGINATHEQAEPVDGCTEENCRRCRTPEGLRTPDMYHAGLSAAAEIADEVCANSRNHLFRSGAKVVAGAIRSAAPAPSASPAEYIKQLEKETSFAKTTLEATREAASGRNKGASPAALTDEQIIEMARPWLGGMADNLRLNLIEFARARLAAGEKK